jgi:hypothetical protein
MEQRTSLARGEGVTGAALVLLAGYVGWTAANMPIGSWGAPGPGMFPLALAVLLFVAGMGVAIRALAPGRQVAAGVSFSLGRVLIAVAALIWAAVLFERLGFAPTTMVFLTILFGGLGTLPFWKALLFAAIATSWAWGLFVWLLGVQLPAGIFGQ